ncbi:MAG: family 78 glycoside hydrolase catalytic domain [Bacteroidetes bacterium]|nr:family 78 glycoside hydrolase catalytic domain [Bacteroidota bacterium]
MRKMISLLTASLLISSSGIAQSKVEGLLTENRVNPTGMDILNPRFSWLVVSDKRNTMQTAYEIRVGNDPASLSRNNKIIWSSGKKESDSSVHVAYQGPSLESRKKYYWQVRVWDNSGKVSAWSEPAYWQMALLQLSDWKAKWIQPGYVEDSINRPSPLFRKTFISNKKIQSALIYITAHGIYEAQINGHRVGDAYLSPGWTAYKKRLQYQVYDVANLLSTGSNAIGVALGSGWYRGFIGFNDNNNFYGKDISLLLQLEITYSDGTMETIVSDESWKSSTGSIKSSELYNGETIDNRDDKPGWATAAYNDKGWDGVKVANFSNDNLIATYNEPVRKHEVFKALRVFTTPKGEKVIDFGQNLVGWVILKVKGKAGDKIVISHAEVLDKSGNFYTDNLRAAKAEDTYILKGGDEEIFEPHFTFHGFQFIRVEGYPGELKPENFTAVTLYSDMKKTGSFKSSDALINQLQHNIEWGQKGNFLDVPTDCPQRDERLGWTGDAQVFSRTAAYNMNVEDFFAKWLKDVAADQSQDGAIPFVVPNVLGPRAGGSTGWADVGTIVPWNMYLAYGDKRILEQQYPSMKAWVEYMHHNSKNDLWNVGFHFGDWLFYRPDDDNDGRAAVTDKYLIAQCFYAHSTQLLINAAKVIGKEDEAVTYTALLQKIKDAFMKEYMTANGRLVSGTQTAYVLALNFDMLPESLRMQAADRLVANIQSYDYHLTTGFLGTPYLCHVLSRFGHTEVAYKLLLQQTYPSWLYPVKMGATTIWERWDGRKPDSTFQTPGMNSFNHYSYGAIGDWMYRVVAGIDTYSDKPGYKHIRIMPHTGEGLTSVAADLQTYYGLVSSHWKQEHGKFVLDVEIPVNATATVAIPASDSNSIQENGKPLSAIKEIQSAGNDNGYVLLTMGSGKYHFEVAK